MSKGDTFQRNPNGKIRAHPLTSMQCAAADLDAVFLRLEWTEHGAIGSPRAKSVQLGMTPEIALLIGEQLVQSAKLQIGGREEGRA